MLESDPTHSHSSLDLLYLAAGGPEDHSVFEKLKSSGLHCLETSWGDSSQLEEIHDLKVLVASFDSLSFESGFATLQVIQTRQKDASLLILDSGLTIEQIDRVLNSLDVFAVIYKEKNLTTFLSKAVDDHDQKRKFNNTLRQVKDQNRKLETLNRNLEEVVYERTKNEFQASQQTAQSLKTIQTILSFIKEIARSDSIENIMSKVRDDFKKSDAFLPPLLILKENDSLARIYYFQGKQMIEKVVFESEKIDILLTDSAQVLRAELSNTMGRPIGPISTHRLDFQSQQLRGARALFVFENSLGQALARLPLDDAKERWPIVTMAIENFLLKENMQVIARQWARTFNNMKDPILIINDLFQMTLSNKSFHKGEVRSCYKSFAGQDRICKGCPLEQTIATGEPVTSNIRVGEKTYQVHSYPIKLEKDSSAFHVINQYVDITQTIDLRSRVIQGEKMAAVGLLAGNIAHELNNPLTGIHSLAELLIEDFNKETNTYKDMTEVKKAAARCQRIIKDLLDFSSVSEETGKKKIDLNSVVKKTLPLLKMAMRSLNSHVDLSDEPLNVQCNSQLLQQVIFNIVNNACQAMDDSGDLFVNSGKQGSFAEIRIRDTGPGIPSAIKESVFDPFFTTKTEGKGTGLGLSMSKSVIDRAGGQLLLNEAIVNGTEFIIRLPLVEE